MLLYKQKTAYEMRSSDWSSDVCSSDLAALEDRLRVRRLDRVLDRVPVEGHADVEAVRPCRLRRERRAPHRTQHQAVAGLGLQFGVARGHHRDLRVGLRVAGRHAVGHARGQRGTGAARSEEHTSELQSLMRISYAVFCLKKKNKQKHN